jgi:putative tricarboxylic transport membrane protein
LNNSNRISSVFFLALSLYVCQQAIVIGVGSLHKPGPGLMLFCAGLGVGCLSLWLLLETFISRNIHKEAAPKEVKLNKSSTTVMVCVSLFVYAIAVNWIGFVLSTLLFTIFLLRLIESHKWWITILEASLITLGNYLIFVVWLGLSLPNGFFD